MSNEQKNINRELARLSNIYSNGNQQDFLRKAIFSYETNINRFLDYRDKVTTYLRIIKNQNKRLKELGQKPEKIEH